MLLLLLLLLLLVQAPTLLALPLAVPLLLASTPPLLLPLPLLGSWERMQASTTLAATARICPRSHAMPASDVGSMPLFLFL